MKQLLCLSIGKERKENKNYPNEQDVNNSVLTIVNKLIHCTDLANNSTN